MLAGSVAIRFSWGDGDTSTWSSFVKSGESVATSHAWHDTGTYAVEAEAKDTSAALSSWSEPHSITVRPLDVLRRWRFRVSNASDIPVISSPAIAPDGTAMWSLDLGGEIKGTITDARNPAAWHLVYFTTANDPTARQTVSFEEGTFAVHGLSDGDYKIGVWQYEAGQYPDLPPPGTVWYPGTTDWSTAQTIAIRGHEVVSGINMVFPRN